MERIPLLAPDSAAFKSRHWGGHLVAGFSGVDDAISGQVNQWETGFPFWHRFGMLNLSKNLNKDGWTATKIPKSKGNDGNGGQPDFLMSGKHERDIGTHHFVKVVLGDDWKEPWWFQLGQPLLDISLASVGSDLQKPNDNETSSKDNQQNIGDLRGSDDSPNPAVKFLPLLYGLSAPLIGLHIALNSARGLLVKRIGLALAVSASAVVLISWHLLAG